MTDIERVKEAIANLGSAPPSAKAIAKALAETTGKTIVVQGAEAARQLQLTTQVPMHLFFIRMAIRKPFNLAILTSN